MHARTRIGSLDVGPAPCVVGVASRPGFFAEPASLVPPCDCMEVRLDLAGAAAEDWLRSDRGATARRRVPLLLTIRSAREGGQWAGDEGRRIARYRELLPFVDAVDVELESESFTRVAAAARAAGRCVIGSFHDFSATPDAARLHALIVAGEQGPADIIKIATWTASESDVVRLETLLRAESAKPVAVMGMGPMGAASRLRLAASGACLVYGYLDEASAPGQLSSAELIARLGEMLPHYRAARLH